MVTADGTTKLCDFGLAIDTNLDIPTSRVGTLVRAHAAPPALACLPQ